jgi:hypothetical protein
MLSKANVDEMMANLNTKATVSDVSRTIAEVQMQLDKKQSLDDVMRLLDDRVTR